MMRHQPSQVIYIYKIPRWAKMLQFAVLSVICYALLTRSAQLSSLWRTSALGKFLLIFACGSLIFFTYAILRSLTIYTKETIYERSWRGYKEVPYRDIAEVFYSKTGSLLFVLKDSSRIEAWVHPSKLDEIVDAVTSSGCRAKRGD